MLVLEFEPSKRELQGSEPQEFLPGAQVTQLTPALGDEIVGVDLTKLDSNGRDRLALHATRRGVLFFRNQSEFLGMDKEWLRDWGQHFRRWEVFSWKWPLKEAWLML